MSVERLAPENAVLEIVDRQINDYTKRFGHMWPGFEEAFAVARLGFYIDTLITTYSTGDARQFYKLEKDPVFEEMQDQFYNDVRRVIGAPFPAADAADKLEVVEAAKSGLNLWIEQRRVPLAKAEG